MVTKPLWTRWFAVAAFGLLAGACADQSPTAIDNDALLSEGSASFSTAKTNSISGVEIYPGSYTLKLSEARQLVAVPVNVLGIATSLGGQLITWKSSNQAVATVSSRGVVSAVGGGRATISAHIGPIVGRAVITVQAYRHAINQYAQASLRDVVGSMSLDDLLSEREVIQTRIAEAVESRSVAWGMHVDAIRLLDINMPEDLKRMMSRQASAEREKRATITKAEGDRDAALNLAAAANTMAESPGAMQLRTLQTLDGLGSSRPC